MEIAAQCRFPDYLGYLGLGLLHTNQIEQQHRLLTPLWGGQLLEMIDEESPVTATLHNRVSETGARLVWRNLDGVERAMNLAY